jgi:S1-C subfamily serine protease
VVSLGQKVKIHFPQPDGGTQAAEFENLIGIKGIGAPFSRGGDSGAPVLSTDGKLLGMVFAGSEAPGGEITFALPIGPVLKALEVELAQ